MKHNIINLKNKMLYDYKIAVGECLYYSNMSFFKEDNINIIKNEYNLLFDMEYSKYIQQFEKYEYEDLENILSILDIEADNEWINANRSEASAIILSEYLKKINLQT
ncbi:MAG: hypothetical protein Q8K30_00135 [Candidatus Gracilibacteria bacterium]|nr:hypothetical protein [Candidatus Gracilibacteria bacterium]